MVDESGAPMYLDYADYIMNHQRKRGHPLAGFRGPGDESGRGGPNAKQLDAYIENGGFWMHELPDALATTKHRTWTINSLRSRWDFMMLPHPMFTRFIAKNYKNSGWRRGLCSTQPPEHLRERVHQSFTPLPEWYAPFEGEMVSESELDLCLTQRPMARITHGDLKIHGYDRFMVIIRCLCPRRLPDSIQSLMVIGSGSALITAVLKFRRW